MMHRFVAGIVLTIGLVGGAAARSTGPLAVEERAPAPVPVQQPAATDDGVLLLMQQLQQYEQELAELRSQVEELRREVDVMRHNERERFLDLDTRINALAADRAPATPMQGGAAGTASVPTRADDDAYLAARQHLAAQDFTAAAKAFEDYLRSFPDGQFRDFAHFWLGEIHRARKDGRATAMTHFRAVIEQHPQSSKVPSALYKLAVLQYEGGDVAAARATLERVVKQFPESSDAALARAMLDQLRQN